LTFDQFSDLASFSDECANRGKIVVVAALDGTYQRKVFSLLNSAISARSYDYLPSKQIEAFDGVIELLPKGDIPSSYLLLLHFKISFYITNTTAEQVIKLSSVCMRCSSDAAFTIRIGSETQVKSYVILSPVTTLTRKSIVLYCIFFFGKKQKTKG